MPLCKRCRGSGEVMVTDSRGRAAAATCPLCHGSGDDDGMIDIGDDLLG